MKSILRISIFLDLIDLEYQCFDPFKVVNMLIDNVAITDIQLIASINVIFTQRGSAAD